MLAHAQARRNGPKRPLTCTHFFPEPRSAEHAQMAGSTAVSARIIAASKRARGPPEPPKDSCLALRRLATLHAALQLHVAALLLHSDPREPRQMREEHRIVEKRAGDHNEDDGNRSADAGGACGRAGGAVQQ